ncbi:PASTA domain-containing protein [Cryobacterium melibiosiphilum]|uniref:PASTA domain-containing protein n=1 Tax=Cryobacterium melibiosiphilum TaxID=995039 RepID=A0A3A5MMK0_9MICO|nr:PASTA domain-containing protein [Cryobacterium melibiosiphilum]RJT88113.1 PASTA domain-containing protein [Cryobacterium melibiosiphilum]
MSKITLALAAATILLLTGCSSSVTVPDVAGMNGAEARDTLESAGFAVEWDADGLVLVASNWDAGATVPAAGESLDDGAEVVVSLSKPEAEPREVEEVEPTPEPTVEPAAPVQPSDNVTASGLTTGTAKAVCESTGDDSFPYGFNGSWTWDGTYQVVDDTIFLKASAKVTNQFDAEMSVTVECTVSGTDDAPGVDAFNTY